MPSGLLRDGVLQDRISGEVGWQQKSYPLGGDGTHALIWVYSKDSNDADGSDRGWVDYLQWTPGGGGGGSSTTDWEQITYTYDPSGRRIAKDVDGEVTKYLYDGVHCVAEYDANDVLLRKFVYGSGLDQPICMIEVADANAAYFYHYDALGSVVALSDAAGDTVQVYEYDVYGQVAASDPNHPNSFMFTGRRFDSETGLYYYRARYYNPTIGRFLQTDPLGYEDGTNMYRYCRNNPLRYIDPTGTDPTDAPAGEMGRFVDPAGTQIIIWPTRNVMVLPYRLDPQTLSDYTYLGQYYKDAALQLGLNIGSVIDFVWPGAIQNMTPAQQLASSTVIAYLYVMGEIVEALPGLAARDTNLWRGFFEVFEGRKDYKGEVSFKRYWIEVCGVRSGLPGDKGYLDIGYWRDMDAYWATVRAMEFYVDWLYGASVPKAWIDPMYVGSYIYFGPYEFEDHYNDPQLATYPGPADYDPFDW